MAIQYAINHNLLEIKGVDRSLKHDRNNKKKIFRGKAFR